METFRQWNQLLEKELTGNVIPFWIDHSIDKQYGGFLTCLDRTGEVYDGQKQMWMQWREVYMFAALYNSKFRKMEFLKFAEDGFDFLFKHGRNQHGKFAYLLDRSGKILSETAGGFEVFTGSFAAIGAAELFAATGNPKYEDESLQGILLLPRSRFRFSEKCLPSPAGTCDDRVECADDHAARFRQQNR